MTRLASVLLAAGLALGTLAACGDDSSSAGPVGPQNQPVSLAGTALAPLPDNGNDPAVGKTAPTLSGKDFSGNAVTVTPATGRPRLILFVAHWCPHCQAEVPRVVKWLADGSIPAGLDLVAVSTGVQASAPNYPPSKWLAKENWTKPVLADSAAMESAKAFGLTSYPYFVLLNADSTVAVRASGELTRAELRKLLATVGL